MGGAGDASPKGRFVLRYRGEGAKPDADVASIGGLPGTTIVDDSSPRMLLVESDEGSLRQLLASLPDWVMGPDQSYSLPPTRREVKRPPA